jgi:hypothetical protein
MNSLTRKTWDSKTALHDHLNTIGLRRVVIGNDIESSKSYYSFEIESNCGDGVIGVVCLGLGMGPVAIVMDQRRRVLVGHDTWMTWIDVREFTVITSCELGGVFYEFLSVGRDDQIAVIHELGVQCADANGVVAWSVDSDVVENFGVDEKGNLVLHTMDGRLVVSLRSGAVSR